VERLLAIGYWTGRVTYEQASHVVGDQANPAEVDALLERLLAAGVEIVEDDEVDGLSGWWDPGDEPGSGSPVPRVPRPPTLEAPDTRSLP